MGALIPAPPSGSRQPRPVFPGKWRRVAAWYHRMAMKVKSTRLHLKRKEHILKMLGWYRSGEDVVELRGEEYMTKIHWKFEIKIKKYYT